MVTPRPNAPFQTGVEAVGCERSANISACSVLGNANRLVALILSDRSLNAVTRGEARGKGVHV